VGRRVDQGAHEGVGCRPGDPPYWGSWDNSGMLLAAGDSGIDLM
jgi:hypothetical protein